MKPRLLGDDTWNALNYEYAHDDSVYFKGSKINYTAEGINIPTIAAMSNTIDQSTNQYSNLYLTDKKRLSDFIGLQLNSTQYPRSYVTYFADSYGWVDTISPITECWHVEDDSATEEEMKSLGKIPEFRVDVKYRMMSNSMLFEVEMLSDVYLRVSHWDGYKRTYLTVNPSLSTVYFDFYRHEPVTTTATQIFEYSHDEATSYISIYKFVDGVYQEFRRIGPELKLYPTTGWDFIPNSFKNTQITSRRADVPVYDTWVSYTDGLTHNNVNINPDKSYTDVVHNYMLNTEYIYNDQNKNYINILPLKNHITNQHQLSRNNPFRNSTTINALPGQTEPDTLFRDYTSLSTGTNQIRGTENIHLNYRDYTELLVFKADKLTYFHMPVDIYPYSKLNVAEAGLIESGSIAGDQPARSDKIFKKRANYDNYSPWGNASDEQSGTYLCTWLYWTGKSTDKPVWLDRYYNPAEFTIYNAMTARPLVEMATVFDNMVLDNPGVEDLVVFDKLSDLCFEPKSLYCYHRIGETDIQNSIGNLTNNLIQNDLTTYKTIDGSDAPIVYDDTTSIYNFTGNETGKTAILDRLLDTNSFSVNFSMYSDDWTLPFGSQLFGNYNNNGFGVFSNQRHTPVYVQPGLQTRLYNSELTEVLTLPISSREAFKAPVSDNIYIYNDDKNGSIYEFDLNGVLRERSNVPVYDGTTYPPSILSPKCVSHDANYMYLVYDENAYSRVNIATERIELLTGITKLKSNHTYSPGEITQVVVVDEIVYGFDHHASNIHVSQNSIVWLSVNTVYEYLINHDVYNVVLESEDYILRNVVSDHESNKYIVYRDYYSNNNNVDYYLLKINSDNTLSFHQPLTSYSNKLSALDEDSNFISNFSLENIQGDDIELYNLATNYLSSYQIFNPDTGESETKYIDTTILHGITRTGEMYRENIHLTPLSTYNRVDNQLYDIITRYDTPENNELTFKLRLRNTYNKDRFEDVLLHADVTDLDRGWHQFCYDYNSKTGKILLFIDSILVDSYDSEPGKYRFTDMSIQQYAFGAAAAYNGVLFNEFLQQPGHYMSKNFKLKDFKIYNTSINYYDIKFFYRNIKSIRDLKWTIPCNSRNYIDDIQHIFKHTRSPTKVDNFNINILSDQIKDTQLCTDITYDLKMRLIDQTPIRSTVDKINWYTT